MNKKELIRTKEEAEMRALKYRTKLMKLKDLSEQYKKEKANIYTVMRDMLDILSKEV